MKSKIKKVIASAMALTSLMISIPCVNVSAAETDDIEVVEMSERAYTQNFSINYNLSSNKRSQYILGITGYATVSYTATVNTGGVSIVILDELDNIIANHYFSSGYAPSFSVTIPDDTVYSFYVMSSNGLTVSGKVNLTCYF